MWWWRVLLLVGALVAGGSPAIAQYALHESGDFYAFREALAGEAVAAGVHPDTVHRALAETQPDPRVLELDRKQPEGVVRFRAYLRNVVTPARLQRGRALAQRHKTLLARLQKQTGVPASVILALWGIESGFGRNQGSFNVFDSLVTLAYDGRRAAFFRDETLAALKIAEQEGLDPRQMEGSWAGAMGQCQFMPSTFLRFAVDGDGDGRRDIWGSEADVLASIAHYLRAEGWRSGENWGRAVRLTRPLPGAAGGAEDRRSLAEWSRLGVRASSGKALPKGKTVMALVQPEGEGGPAFLVGRNYEALKRWNRSTSFALTVGLFTDQLRSGAVARKGRKK